MHAKFRNNNNNKCNCANCATNQNENKLISDNNFLNDRVFTEYTNEKLQKKNDYDRLPRNNIDPQFSLFKSNMPLVTPRVYDKRKNTELEYNLRMSNLTQKKLNK
jgi:hypothetical protein